MTSSARDRELGMNRAITRRDFLNGAAMAVGAMAVGWPRGAAQAATKNPAALTGLRGHHPGSFEVMHSLRDGTFWQNAGAPQATGETYDLIVVGGGISGLAAAFLYRQQTGGKARVLILENHDDFGGHAKRNEFTAANGKQLIGYGGSQSLQTPSYFTPAVKTPLNDKAQRDLIELIDGPKDYLSGKSQAEKLDLLSKTTYAKFLTDICGYDPQLVTYYQTSTQEYFGIGIDGTTCLDARGNGNPGFDGIGLGDAAYPTMSPSCRLALTDPDPYIYHFPDGNAGVARALVRALVPRALPGSTMPDLVTTPVDYGKLDEAGKKVRIRLNAPVVRVKHQGPAGSADAVEVAYVENGKLKTVSAGHVVLACWHRVIPYLTDELAQPQIDALNDQQKVPLIYGTVLIRNWEAFKKLGIAGFEAPSSFWLGASIDYPVSMGSYKFADKPGDPVLLHIPKVLATGEAGVSERDQNLAGRLSLVDMKFEDMEREIRDMLGRALGDGGFDPAGDIEAITANRWSHGYAYEYMSPWDAFWPDGPLPIETARKPWGRIAIANSDSGAYAYAHSAIDQAARAVKELLGAKAKIAAYADFPGPPRDLLGLK